DGNCRGHFRRGERSGNGVAAGDALDICAPGNLLYWRTCRGRWRGALDEGGARRKSLRSRVRVLRDSRSRRGNELCGADGGAIERELQSLSHVADVVLA